MYSDNNMNNYSNNYNYYDENQDYNNATNNINNYGNDYNYYDENQNYNNTTNSNKFGLIIKILIIIICIIALIWLIMKLKEDKKDVSYNNNIHVSNIEKVRLAGEKHFFIDNNLPNVNDKKMVELATLIKKGYVSDIIDANQKVCNDLKSMLTIKNDGTRYILVISLSCSTNEQEEIFYYDLKTKACLNCNGSTLMDGKTKENDDTIVEEDHNYSCDVWSDWSDKKENNNNLDERTRVVVLGVKKANSTVCETWSDYTTSLVNQGINGLIEEKEETEIVWSSNKTSRTPIQDSENIKVISTKNVSGSSYSACPSGYSESGSSCVSNNTKTSDLTFNEYSSGKYQILNAPCNAVNTEKDASGRYVITYKGCQYKDIVSKVTKHSSGYTEYIYQEKETRTTKQYRYCLKLAPSNTNDEYTKDYYEESNLPEGFEKVSGSEKTQYSYKLKVCEK